jgi:hypothetical protein
MRQNYLVHQYKLPDIDIKIDFQFINNFDYFWGLK